MATDILGLFGPEFFGFILPWIFSFAIVYGLIVKANVFGQGATNQRVAVAIAFVVAFFVSAVGGPTLANFFITLFGGAALFLGGILVVILLLALVGANTSATGTKAHTAVGIIVIIIGIFLFLASSSSGFVGFRVDQGLATMVFIVLILILAVYYISQSGGDETPKEKKKPGE